RDPHSFPTRRSSDLFGLIEQLRARGEQFSTVMMLSSPNRSVEAAHCRQLGVPDYVTKPVKPSRLVEAVSDAIRGGRSDTGNVRISAKATRRLRVLVAEDNLVNQRLMRRLFEKQNHEVTVVGDGLSA